MATATCPATFVTVIGCVSPGEACADTTDCDSVLGMGNGPITTQQCTGHQQYNTAGIADIQSICCAQTSNTESIECQQIIGGPSGTADGDVSEISCKQTFGNDWFLTSCGEYVQSSLINPRLDGHISNPSAASAADVCWAQNSGYNPVNGNSVTYPVAQCCRIGISLK